MPIHGSGVALLIDRLSDLNFYDEFNREAVDADIWENGGDAGGGFSPGRTVVLTAPTLWRLTTGNVIDDDQFIHGGSVKNNKSFSPWEIGYSTITWETRLNLESIADISLFLGLIFSVITDYAEPVAKCVHFFADPAVNANFNCRSYNAAETETDSGIALDTAFHKFKIVWTATIAKFYIDDVLVATHTTNLPDGCLVSEFLIRTEAVAFKSTNIDYVRVEVT